MSIDIHQIHYSTAQSDFDISLIHEYLQGSYWSQEIPYAVVEQAITHSFCMGAFLGTQQIGFARLITDYATFAYLADVFVLDTYQKQGVGKALIAQLMQQVNAMDLRRVLLATRDAHSLYARYGFSALGNPQKFMEIARPNMYVNAK
ncbi:GNAT family N-acetyltransferase [Acinetobacter sp. NIPH 2699]|uniref:GNAT family N-acetyltransferase n=1 Tax=Acinetobacter sp. NIPH 2699 TaxID=2923433 RepID=UPI001F4B8A9B|nr:GNAT family N-acetyltransferase [Acinetobacter sp. NIPH 2699]MCH7336267.1 GNAT family N-acetyltransferase [Acinetobacter sp. NIPH 2699]